MQKNRKNAFFYSLMNLVFETQNVKKISQTSQPTPVYKITKTSICFCFFVFLQ